MRPRVDGVAVAFCFLVGVAALTQGSPARADETVTPSRSSFGIGVRTSVQESRRVAERVMGRGAVSQLDWNPAELIEACGTNRDGLTTLDPLARCQVLDTPLVDPVATPPGSAPDPVAPVVTPGMVLEAFRRIPLPASVLRVQPPEGETLVNFETNFYTEAEPFSPSVRLLGQRVDLRIWPSSYTWVYGDGESRTGASPGAPYPDLEVTHVYLRKGRVAPWVDTTWSAEFRVGGGGWRPVDGTVTITGEPQGLRVLEAQPNLVGEG